MADEEEDFQFINYNFPPDPPCYEEVNGKITCDFTGYDPPACFPSKVCLNHKLQVLKLFIDDLQIPKELGNLHQLEHLVLCRCDNDINPGTKITKIPATLKNLQNLKVLDLRNNPLQMFPLQLTELFKLEELHVSNCQLTNLPDSFAKLQQLKTLDLSNNLFKDLPSCIMKLRNLCKLYLSDGCLQNLSEEIKSLVNLERLQLTSNELTSLPEGLFELVNLKKLYLNNNKLTSLHDKVGNLVNLEYLVLNQNKLTKIPESIGKLKELRYLNLHENMLSCLPESVTSLEQIETLLVDHNPLQVPPVHVCNQGIQSVRNYFEAMKNTKNIHAKRLKVLVLGESMAGKTSLVKALMTGESTQIDEDDRTFGVVFYHWKPEPDVDELELMVVDCAGQKKYQMTHQLFLSEGALFILAVDLFQYTFDSPERYQENVGQWISLVAARIPRARILVVPTHIDQCPNEETIDLKIRNILRNMKEQREEMVSEIDKKIKHVKKTEGHCIPSDELAKILEQHREQKDNLPVISLQYKEVNHNLDDTLAMNVTPVSNTSLELGMVSLRQELVRIARNKNLSPNIDINLPESWVNIEQAIKKCRKNGKIPCLSIAELQEVLKEQGIDVSECELHSCVSYLDAIGELQYFKGIHDVFDQQVEVTAGFALSQYLPCGVFMRFSVLCHRHEPDDYDHWQKGFYMKFGDVLIHSSVSSAHKCGTLKVAARAPQNQLDTLWRILLILLEEIQKLLKEWPGLNYVPFTVCPHCIQNDVAHPHQFTCNWFNFHQSAKRRATCKTDGTSHEVQLDLLFPSKDVLNGYRKSVVIHPNEIPDCLLKDDLLDEIADQLGTRWPRLARKLDLSSRVGSIKEDHRGDTHEQAVEMLTNWKRRLGRDAKIEIIVEALREIGFNDIADFIVSRCQGVPVENSSNTVNNSEGNAVNEVTKAPVKEDGSS
ncbi:malignant fibrous histiocytoma-amplified sequence 1 homolog [Paramuricea clavata]|uniref:Malignant fibrous histiocytoma-amplified sequence 1 homolog n=1 Tax=Paramuricea clavata TaxID=317549 RepID=A0A7D9HH86_PARCT|nr:malignant fibrous histiocytoma-amplified sequence 1 homolog [Paramuricea clavata]